MSDALLSYDDVVRTLDDLPSLPAVVMELLNSIDQDDVDISVLAKKVSHDQALTAKTLRLANSSLYGLQVKVTTIQQAITYLGFQTTRNLITAAAVTGCFAEGACKGFDHKAFWRHSIATAACAKILARHMRFNQDYAFTAGLLHDIGRLALATHFPEQFNAALALQLREKLAPLQAERQVMGTDHAQVGALVAVHWNFPPDIAQAIAQHHGPEPQKFPGVTVIDAVHVADAIAHAVAAPTTKDDKLPPLAPPSWERLGLASEHYLGAVDQTKAGVEALCQALGV